MTSTIRLLIADDHLVVRRGFMIMLAGHDDIELVGEAEDGTEAVKLCDTLKPDVVLMDIMMPMMDGIDATRQIKEKHPQTQVVLLTSFENDVKLVQHGLEAGALSFLYKDIDANELGRVIRDAKSNHPYLAPKAVRNLIRAKTQPDSSTFNLSPRELDVLKLLVKGMTNGEIATQLNISPATVKFHVSSLLGKLHATTRTEAATIAVQHHLIDD